MVWNSAGSEEYPNVREFAMKRKLASMSAHDSIIGAWLKQTRDANRKRQLVPFSTGDFVYLSTKNITFAKGLARKLIPKYIGPYKIIQDFNNQSFKLELPTHLKRRGVHDVFHSSLLKIHVPNDDRLFPGRLDTQIGDGPDTEDKWAVDVIRSHAGSGENSTFEIKWKSGDVTWMPLYQVKHLQALDAYLELMGVSDVSQLPTGKGQPPPEDPQIFLGGVSLETQNFIISRRLSTINSFSDSSTSYETPSSHPILIISDPLFHFLSSSFPILSERGETLSKTPTELYHFLLSVSPIMITGIRHPYFRRVSKTEYLINDPANLYRGIVHVGQIFKYLVFDKSLRDGRLPANLSGMPLGYLDFANSFNTGVPGHDTRRLSTITYHNNQEQVTLSDHPVSLRDFVITMEQCGLSVSRSNGPTSAQSALITTEYAAVMAEQNARRRRAIQERQSKRQNQFNSSEPRSRPTKRSRHDFKPTPEYHTYANNGAITPTESEYSDVIHTHQASHNQIVPESDSAVDHSQSTEFLDASPLDIVEEFIDAIAQLPEPTKPTTTKEVGPIDSTAMQV